MDDEREVEIERRALRPRMSLGGVASFMAIIVIGIGAVRYFDNIEYKLDNVAAQVSAIGDVRSDISQLKARMDGLEGWFRYVVTSNMDKNRNGKGPP